MIAAETRPTVERYRTGYGAGKVHYGEHIPRLPFYIRLACSGRAVEGAYRTDATVTCKACIRKQGS
jgi:hypothetical protein